MERDDTQSDKTQTINQELLQQNNLKQKGYFLPIIGVIILILVVGIGAYLYGKKGSLSLTTTKPSVSSESQASATPRSTVDETTDWVEFPDPKGYPEGDYIYTIKLPKDWSYAVNMSLRSIDFNIPYPQKMKIDVVESPETLKQYTTDYWSKAKEVNKSISDITEIEHGENKGFTFTMEGGDHTGGIGASGLQKYVFLGKNKYKVRIIYPQDNQTVQRVLSTFKFTE